MPWPPSVLSRAIIFNSKSIIIGHSTWRSRSGTASGTLFSTSIISSVFFSNSASLTFVKYDACSGSSGASLFRNVQNSRTRAPVSISASYIDHVSDASTSDATYAYLLRLFSPSSSSGSLVASDDARDLVIENCAALPLSSAGAPSPPPGGASGAATGSSLGATT